MQNLFVSNHRRIVLVLVVFLLSMGIFFTIPMDAKAAHDDTEIATLKAVINGNLGAFQAVYPSINPDDVTSWGSWVTWSTTPERAIEINLTGIALSGTVDLSNLGFLVTLNGTNNPNLTKLILNGCASLRVLDVSNNALDTLDLTGCINLINLACFNNKLTTLDLSNISTLQTIDCQNNALTILDASKSKGLIRVTANNNKLDTLDLDSCQSLTTIDVFNNSLNVLDVSNCINLYHLYCQDNEIAELDIRASTQLAELSCYNNKLTALDVSNNVGLVALNCEHNAIPSLDLSKCTSLKTLWATNNKLKSIDVKNSPLLTQLFCAINPITKIDVSGMKNLDELNCYQSNVASIDVTGCDKLTIARIYENPLKSFKAPDGDICTTKSQGPGNGYINGYSVPTDSILLRAVKEGKTSTFISWKPVKPENLSIKNAKKDGDKAGYPDIVSPPGAYFAVPKGSVSVLAVFEADFSKLKSLIKKAEGLIDNAVIGTKNGNYTQESVDKLNKAIKAAQKVYNNRASTQAEIDSAVKALQKAIDAFKPIKKDSNDSGGGDSSNSDDDPTSDSDKESNENSEEDYKDMGVTDLDGDGDIDYDDYKIAKEQGLISNNPPTEDTNNLLPFTIMLSVSIVGLSICILARRRLQ